MNVDRFPLTPLQHSMVGAWLRRPRSGLNVEQWIVTLREPVQTSTLRTAWRDAVRTYGMLRSAIDLSDTADPQQTIAADVDGAWEELDWRNAPSDEQAARWQEFLEADRCRGFDLTRPPLWRVTLIRTGEDEYRFVCTYHHVLLGGGSLVLLGRELFERYDALNRGDAPTLATEAPFRKFVERAAQFDPAAAETYWRNYLADRAPVRLPEPHAPPTAETDPRRPHRSVELQRMLDAAATARLNAAAREADVTLHTLVQAAWGITLAAFTGEDDQTFGSVRACRKLPVEGISRMIGMLINTVPFRVQLRLEETVEQLLGRLREAQLEHRQYETTPASDVARYVRQASDEPLFPTLLMFTDRRPESMLDVDGRPHPTRSVQLLERSEFPLALVVGADDVTSIRLEYDADRYSAATAERLLEHFTMILEALPDSLSRPIDALPSVTPADRKRLAAFGRSMYRPDATLTVPALIETRAESRPDDVAIIVGSRCVSYAELQRMTTTAAANLRRRGIGRGSLVGAFCDRSPEAIALTLGLWRVGAVYVPLDPKYPSQRLGAIVADAGTALVVHDRQPPEALAAAASRTIELSALFDGSAEDEGAEPASLADRAVVLYTSGSTGTPKGVVLTHGNLANQHQYIIRTLGLTAGDRMTPVSSINFDASLEEHFCPLAAGATIVLSDSGTLDSCLRFLDFIERQRLTVLDLPTSLWRELTNYLYDERREYPDGVRAIMMGGEAATRTVYERFLKVGGRRIRWFNAYGPTETTICSTCYEHRPERDAGESAAPPIGRPIDGTTAWVVDRRGRLVPPGVRGELYVGGAGVAEGYLNRDDLTAERFVEVVDGDVPPGRYYRTGDEVRFRADGELEYVGRLDQQVKLRGFRIEPGEIEATLLKHPAVRDAAVTVLTSSAGTQYLAAYLVLHAGATWDERSLREFAAARLPQYMMPQALVQLDALPLSPNGKIERRSLPEPFVDVHADDRSAESTAPRMPTPLEQRLLEVWQATLGLDEFGLDDDFFLLGGDSLRAMTLAARLEQVLGRSISAATLVAAPTVARLAAQLNAETVSDADEKPAAVALLREGNDERPLFFVHSLAGDVWIYHELTKSLGTRSALYGLQLPEDDAVAIDEIEAYAADCVRRVRSLQPAGPYRLAGYSSGGLMAYEMARQLTAAGESVEFLGLIDSGVPPAYEAQITASAWMRVRSFVRNVPPLVRELHDMTAAEIGKRFVRFGVRCLRRLTAAASSNHDDHGDISDRELMECFAEDISFFPARRLEQIKRHCRAVFRYLPKSWNGAAQLFRVARQPLSSVPTATLGWERLTSGAIDVYAVAGSHEALMRGPNVQRLAEAMDAALRNIEQKPELQTF